jgi:7-cyano-7-deazaguanine synthase
MAIALSDTRALVLFSGGQDSTTCLAWALERFEKVETIGFDYGQRHAVELQCRDEILERLARDFPRWAPRLSKRHTIDLKVLGDISATALTRNTAIQMDEAGLPNTFVPGRNLLFLSFAACLAYRRDIRHIVGGMCETDYSGYPDCRDATIKALQSAINLGMDAPFELHTPLMWIDKAATWRMAYELGGPELVDLIVAHSHTCYTGDRTHRHPWGYGCGTCPACKLRARGFSAYQSGTETAP